MAKMFADDQAVRKNIKPEQLKDMAFVRQMIAADAARRTRTQALLDAGKLATPEDYYAAAFIFQHGSKPEDYLLAHTLAVAATARGKKDASWIAAATLDRYLQMIGQKQIYGTQYTRKGQEPATQEPYDGALVPDALRAAFDVPPLAEQEKKRVAMDAK